MFSWSESYLWPANTSLHLGIIVFISAIIIIIVVVVIISKIIIMFTVQLERVLSMAGQYEFASRDSLFSDISETLCHKVIGQYLYHHLIRTLKTFKFVLSTGDQICAPVEILC